MTSTRQVRLALVALATGATGIGLTEFVTMGLLPEIAAGIEVGIPTAGHVVSAYALGVVVGAPLITVFAARTGRKRLLLVLMLLFAAGNLGSALSSSYGALMLARFVSGLPHGAFFGIGALVAASLVPPNRRAWAVSMTMLGLTGSNVFGVPLATLMGQQWGWQAPYLLICRDRAADGDGDLGLGAAAAGRRGREHPHRAERAERGRRSGWLCWSGWSASAACSRRTPTSRRR